jgi:DNA polymerase
MLRSQALQILEEKVAACSKCEELASYRENNRYKTVPGVGNHSARLMVIGEAPGENEAKTGVPFCGKAGNLLTNILKAAGWRREDVFITNTLKCRPPGNRDPEPCEAANCRKFLAMQIKVIEPEWIVCFGRIASLHLLGLDPDTTIGELRGRVHDHHGIKVICTYHPAYVLHSDKKDRQEEAKAAIWQDLQPAISALRS